jgi:hypothetical protein
MRRSAILLLLAAALALAGSWPRGAVAQGGSKLTPVERPPEDELILEMRLGRFVLSDGVLGYLYRGGVLLPLDEIARALEFPIVADPGSGQAEGWFLRENRRFSLDMGRGEVVVEGRRGGFDPALAELHVEDIYVDTTLLSQWFPVDFEFDLSRLLITVTSREPLPLEERLERERRAALIGRGALERPVYERQALPYKLVDWPFFDTTHAFNFDNDRNTFGARSTTLITGDLLFMDGTLFLAGNDQEPFSDVRFTMGRKDPESGLLGPLGLSEVALGDVFTPQIPLVAGQREGRGVAVSSFELNRPTEFDRTTLRGELPLGWEVELYRNEIVLDFQRSRGDGRYEFVDVPLLFGLNVLTLQFYGPQGQRRQETQRLFVGPGLVRPGDRFYRLAVNQQDEDTIQVNEDSGLADPRQGKLRLVGEYEHGITRNLALAGAFSSFYLDDGRHTYPSIGLRSALLGAFVRLDATKDLDSGSAVQGSVQTRLFGVNLLAEHGQFLDGFVSERVTAATDPLESRSNVRLNGTIPEWIVPRIPVSLNGRLDRRASGRMDMSLSNRLSMFYRGVSASNFVDWQRASGGGLPDITSANGSMLMNGRIQRLNLRGTLAYTIDPIAEFTSASLTADYAFERDSSARVTLTRQLTGDQRTTITGGLFHIIKNVALGANATFVDDGSFRAGLTLTFSTGREPRTGSFERRPRGMARSGAASARVFLDRNLDGVFGAGDRPLEGVGFSRRRDLATDEDGIAFLTGLSAYRPTDVVVDAGSLEDPFWVPTREGVEIVPRPGKTALVDFAVVPTGEIDGTAYLRRGEQVTEVSNVALQLVDQGGKAVKEVRSSFDGFFLFEFVRPGRYLVRVSPEQVTRLRLIAPPAQEVVVGVAEDEGDIVAGLEFVIERLAADAGGEPQSE